MPALIVYNLLTWSAGTLYMRTLCAIKKLKPMKSITTTFVILTTLISAVNGQEISEFYKGGTQGLFEIVGRIKYPPDDRTASLEGKVLFKIRIKDQDIDSLEIINSVGPSIDKEATRVLLLTNGGWLINSEDFFIFPLAFKMDYPGREDDQVIMSKRDKSLKQNKTEKALKYCEEIKRRNPFDLDNLTKLSTLYTQVNQLDKAKSTEYLLEQIRKLRVLK
jgi:hypothetical protein